MAKKDVKKESEEGLIKSIWALKGAVEKLTEELAKPRLPSVVYVSTPSPWPSWWWDGTCWKSSGNPPQEGSWSGSVYYHLACGPTPPPAPPSPSSGKPLA